MTDSSDRDTVDGSSDGDEAAGTERRQSKGAHPSRRTFLQATAAAGAITGLSAISGAQDTTTEEGDQQEQEGFFQQGTEVGTQMVAQGMTAPTDFAVPQGDDERQFVTDQTGQVWIITSEGRQDEPFIDVQDRMVELGTFYGLYASPDQEYDERGLLGITFHPNFQENRRFYLHYSAPPTEELKSINWDHIEVLSEFRANEDLSGADPESERQLLRIPSPQYNHDAGPMAFGPDDYLYFPMGDGGGANDDFYGHVPDWYNRNTGGNAQDVRNNLMGDILRIDVDNQEDDKPYGIPDDNPFVDTEAQDEIYAYGFRNPFGISFDSQGNLFQADAGQNLWEEANVVERGGNYGWNVKEGTHCFSTEQPSDASAITDCPNSAPDEAPYNGAPLIDPIVEYPHTYEGQRVGVVIVGGHRYEQSTISGLQGKYVFGEYNGNPAGQQPDGRVFAAAPPEDFGQGDGAATEAGNQTAGNQTEMGDATETTTEEMGNQTVGNETEMGNATETTEPGTPQKAPAGNETVTTVAGEEDGEEDIPPEGPEVVPRDELWEMEELVFEGEFNWFVRMFGQDNDGEIYVLVSKNGNPQGDTGAVLRLVPPGEGEAGGAENATEGNATES